MMKKRNLLTSFCLSKANCGQFSLFSEAINFQKTHR